MVIEVDGGLVLLIAKINLLKVDKDSFPMERTETKYGAKEKKKKFVM